MTKRAPYTSFGEIRMVPIRVVDNKLNEYGDSVPRDVTLWVKRGKDWCACVSYSTDKNTKIRMIERTKWLNSSKMSD